MTSTDFVLPFRTDKTGLRGRFVRLNHVVEAVIRQHAYPEPVAYILAQCLALAGALSSLLKFDGVFSLQTKSDGPIAMVVVDTTNSGKMRGYAKYNQDYLNQVLGKVKSYIDQPVPLLLGNGHMALTIDQRPQTDLYQGITTLIGPTLADCAKHYFAQSEQIDTLIHLVADFKPNSLHHKVTWCVAALMLQKMPPPSLALADEQRPIRIIPEETKEGWERAKMYFNTIKAKEMLDSSYDANNFLYALFHEEGVRVYPVKTLTFGCQCNRERLGKFLYQLSPQERQELAQDGVITVTCDFCNKAYAYNLNNFKCQNI